MPTRFQLHFHPSLRSKILSGSKSATTRLRGEDDPNSTLESLRAALARGPQRCAAITDEGTFAELEVQRARSVKLEEVDDELARLEDCDTAADLRALVRRLYPDVAELAQDLDRDDERRERLPRMLSREEAFPSLDAGERPGDPARRRDGEVEDVEQGVVGDVRI